MPTVNPRPLRALFLTLMTLLVAFVAVESALTPVAEARVAEGLSACGTEESPCLLEMIEVEIEDASEASPRMASTVSARKMLRMRS
jgi:hypothetical protein